MKPSISYDVDPHNRLIVRRRRPSRKSRLGRFRQILHGRFKTDNKNRLYYELYKPQSKALPQKIKFSGNYLLNKDHNLIFHLSKWGGVYRKGKMRLRTQIIDAKDDELLFLLSSKTPENKKVIYTLKLQGAWQADRHNRLIFGVRKEKNKTDSLTFYKCWKINNNYEILYNHTSRTNSFILKGTWKIKRKYKISCILNRKINSCFDFRTSLGKVIPKGKKTYIKFRIIIDISKKKHISRMVMFESVYKLRSDRKIILKLKPDPDKEKSIRLTKDILGRKGIAYIESMLRRRERYIGSGVAFRW